jgi:hypothetical protein
MKKKPEIGDIVLWFDHADKSSSPHPAIVTAIGMQNCVCLNIFDPTRFNTVIRDGVRHIDDPDAQREELKSAGGWDFRPKEKAKEAPEAGDEFQQLKVAKTKGN